MLRTARRTAAYIRTVQADRLHILHAALGTKFDQMIRTSFVASSVLDAWCRIQTAVWLSWLLHQSIHASINSSRLFFKPLSPRSIPSFSGALYVPPIIVVPIRHRHRLIPIKCPECGRTTAWQGPSRKK